MFMPTVENQADILGQEQRSNIHILVLVRHHTHCHEEAKRISQFSSYGVPYKFAVP